MSDPVTLTLTVIERLASLAALAFKAASAGDHKAVDEILPNPDDYPDEHAYQRLKRQADADYGPSSHEHPIDNPDEEDQ